MSVSSIIIYVIIGSCAGIASAFFGIGGGVIVVPALVYFAGYSQLSAIGTSLAVLLPPIGLAAALEYYRHGHVNFLAAIIIAVTLFLTSWIAARFTVRINQSTVKIIFGVFLVCLGLYTVISAIIKVE